MVTELTSQFLVLGRASWVGIGVGVENVGEQVLVRAPIHSGRGGHFREASPLHVAIFGTFLGDDAQLHIIDDIYFGGSGHPPKYLILQI